MECLAVFNASYHLQMLHSPPLFEKQDVVWEHLRRAGGRAGGRAASTGSPLSKSKSFHPVFIKLGEYVGGHNISTKFYNQPNLSDSPELWPLNCPKSGIPFSKSKSFHPVFIKLDVGGYNISTKFYNLANSPRHS